MSDTLSEYARIRLTVSGSRGRRQVRPSPGRRRPCDWTVGTPCRRDRRGLESPPILSARQRTARSSVTIHLVVNASKARIAPGRSGESQIVRRSAPTSALLRERTLVITFRAACLIQRCTGT